jgi:hypothetical protein
MTKQDKSELCFNCGRKDAEAPLVNLRYGGQQTWICTQCLPILIHHPEQLTRKLKTIGGTYTHPGEQQP